MTVWNLGSINIDHIYLVPHIPAPGETLAAKGYSAALGGKGANQSVAAARAGARVLHVGAVGPEGGAAVEAMAGYGVDVRHVSRETTATGHAIICVDDAGENAITIFPGANRALGSAHVAALGAAAPGDRLLMQNETSAQAQAAALAHARGVQVIYSAAPFDPASVRAVVDHVGLLAVNEGEARALVAAMGSLPPVEMIVTLGARGAEWRAPGREPLVQPAFRVQPVDTTGAGDTFVGWLAAALDLGLPREAALRQAAAAAAIQVTRPGAAPAIPTAFEVEAFLARI